MARYAPLWQQAGNYSAQVDRQLFAALWPAGGASGGPIVAQANTLNVSVPAGRCAVPIVSGRLGRAVLAGMRPRSSALNAGPGAGTSRIDLVVVTVRDAAISGANNVFIAMQVLTGPGRRRRPAAAEPGRQLIRAVPGARAGDGHEPELPRRSRTCGRP